MHVNCMQDSLANYLWPTVQTSHVLEQLQLLQYSSSRWQRDPRDSQLYKFKLRAWSTTNEFATIVD